MEEDAPAVTEEPTHEEQPETKPESPPHQNHRKRR